MKKIYTTLGVICLSVLTLTAQNTQVTPSKKESFSVFYKSGVLIAKPVVHENAAGGPCLASADTWSDLNNSGGAPCYDTATTSCVATDAGFTAFGVYGSETYLLEGVEAGFDYVFDMCAGVGAGAWIPEIVILAPDGSTIDASNNASSSASVTHADQCSLAWTATQSGEYSIVINELGTAAGDAPNQSDCATSYAVDNGNPTVTCGISNPAICGEAGPCEADSLISPLAQDVCPSDSALFELNGTPTADGGFAFAFSDVLGGTGGAAGGFSIGGYADTDFPLMMNNDVNGVLSANSLDVMEGDWAIVVYALDAAGDPCDSTAITVVTFLPASDPSCPNSISEETLNLDVYPNPSNGNVVIEMTGDNSDATINVYDMTGRVVYAEAVVITSNYRKILDLDVVDGSYILSIVGDEAVITRKLEIRK